MKHHIPGEILDTGTLGKSNINKANEKWGVVIIQGPNKDSVHY